jgi:hypothetical protein
MYWSSRGEPSGIVENISRRGLNVPSKILSAISQAFDTAVVSEHEPEYWGYDTEEAWDAAWKTIHDQKQEEFYNEICKFVRGEPNSIGEGTVGEMQAKIARNLVAENPNLVLPESQADLMKATGSVYKRNHAVVVTLGREEIDRVLLSVLHEDGLPQC